MKSLMVGLGLFGLVTPVAAIETNQWTAATVNNTPATALDWTADANWSLGHAPAAGDVVTFAARTGVQFVRLPDSLTLSGLNLVGDAYVLGEDITFTSAELKSWPRAYNGWIFADVAMAAAAGEYSPWIGSNHFCGRIISVGEIIPAGGMVYHRLDRYATSPDPLRTDDLQIAASGSYHPGNANLAVYAAGATASSSAWSQTAGSPYISLADASAEATAVGAAVTGAGIPAGTYVRRRLTDRTQIELSQPVTESLTSNVLSFAAFNPDARLHVPKYWRQGQNGSELKICRRQAADSVRFEIDTFTNSGGAGSDSGEYWLLGLTAGEAGWLPGTLVLHTVNGGHRKGPSDRLRNCHLVFAGTADGGNTVFGESRIMAFDGAAYTARLEVPEGTGEVANFTNLVGTLVKDGAGTLKVGLADAVNAGALDVQAGTLELTARASAGTDGVSFASLSMAAGATLRLPAEGMTVAAATFGDGVTVQGPGTLRVKGPKTGRVTCLDGAQVVYTFGTADAYVHEPAAEVAGHPAFWVDASKPESLVTVEEGGVKYVTRWNDWRAGEPMFCTNVVRRPRLFEGPEMKDTYVKIAYVGTHWYTNTEALVWSQPIDHIRAVFLVQDPSDGGGEILGRTTRLGDSYYGSQGGPYYRGGGANCQGAIISPNYATQSVKFGRFFRDGEEFLGYEKGYLGNFMQLVEHHVNTNYAASGSRRELCCDAFGAGGYRDGHEFNSANGRQRIAECIVYTNSLTHAERVRTAQYLSRKWLGKDIVYSDVDAPAVVGDCPFAAGEAVEVPADQAVGMRRVEDGAAFAKTGAGVMVVDSLAAGDVTVEAGELRVKSLSLANGSVPSGAWVHVDAADADSLATGTGNAVTKWRSLAGDGQEYRPLTGTPKLVPGALNGRPVVDCGTLNGADKAALILHQADGTRYLHSDANNWITGAPFFKSVFVVYGSQGGGNSVLGTWGNGYPWQGLAQMPSERGLPMFTSKAGSYNAWSPAETTAFSNGTHVARLNGETFDPFTTPFSGGWDLLTVSGNLSRKSDSLATYGQNCAYAGGLSYGEVLIYSNQLDAATLPKVEAYLRKKWFNVDTAGFRQATCTALRVAEGARVSVEEWAVAQGAAVYEEGAGVLTTTLLSGGGTVSGNITLAAGGVLEAAVAEGGLPTLTVEGALALPADGTLRVTGDVADLAPGRYVLVACPSLDAAPIGWTVEAPAKPCRSYALRREAGALVLNVANAGTVLIFR